MKKKRYVLLVFLTLALLTLTLPVQAAAKKKTGWEIKNGSYCYYNAKGKALKGIHKIKGRYYYFDSNHILRNGWRYYQGDYYFFRTHSGKGAYMVTGATEDGIRLDRQGKAVITARTLRKLKVLVRAAKILDSQTTMRMSMPEKKRIMFNYMVKNYTVSAIGDLFTGVQDWDVAYAEWMLNRGYGDCYAYAAAYAYFLNAIGYANPLMVASGGHAWAEQKGRFYDPNWATVIGIEKTYGVPASLSGKDSRPDWASNRVYIHNIDTLG